MAFERTTDLVPVERAQWSNCLRTLAAAVSAERVVEQCLKPQVRSDGYTPSPSSSLVVSDRVLQWLTPDAVEPALYQARAGGQNAVFRISTRYSSGPAVDGQNEFFSVRDSDWWRAKVEKVFGYAEAVSGTASEYCILVTFPIDAALETDLEQEFVLARRAHKWYRRGQRVRGAFWRLWRSQLSESQLLSELVGRHVALVGNADSLSARDYGAWIDSADVVVRCNRGIIVSAQTHGERTDWLVTGLAMGSDTARRRGVSRIVWASLRPKMMRNIPAWMYAAGRMHVFSKRRDRELRQKLGKTASTGMKAIDLLAASPCRRLDIYGFDFGDSRSASQPTQPMSSDHDFEAERLLAVELIRRDNRIFLNI